jgi:hypothetical protein
LGRPAFIKGIDLCIHHRLLSRKLACPARGAPSQQKRSNLLCLLLI